MVATDLLPALGPIAPPPGVWGAAVAGLQCFQIAGAFVAERANPTEYSKFASGKKLENPIPTQNGMFRIYIPSTVAAAVYTAATFGSDSFSLAAPLLFVHFLKRTLEVAFVHDYSGEMPATNANGIGTYYTLVTLLIASTAVPMEDIASQSLLAAGLALFTLGELGNGYHHYLLTLLRKKADKNAKKRYLPPTGGLFAFVAAPHYFFELMAWLGIACVSQEMNAFLAFAGMVSYLAGRAYKTNEMYFDRFSKEEWPKSKKALLPGVF